MKQRYKREAMASRVPDPGRGAALADQVPASCSTATVDLKDFKSVLTHLLERTQPETDLLRLLEPSRWTRSTTRGPRSTKARRACGWGWAIRCAGSQTNSIRAVEPPRGCARDPRVFSPGCLVVGAPSAAADPCCCRSLRGASRIRGVAALVVTDEPARAAASAINFLWTTFTRFEPAADLYAAGKRIARNHVVFRAPIVIDARLKPGFPKSCSRTRRPRRPSPRDGTSTSRRASRWGTPPRGT